MKYASAYNLQIGTRTGKRLKLVMGRLADQHKQARKVVGIDSVSGLPREEVISAYVVNAGIMNCVNEIGAQMKVFSGTYPAADLLPHCERRHFPYRREHQNPSY